MIKAAQVAHGGLDHGKEPGLVGAAEPFQHPRFELGDGRLASSEHTPPFRRQACGSLSTVVGVRDALDQPSLLEILNHLVHRLGCHERAACQLRVRQGRAMPMEHTQGGKLKRCQIVPSGDLAD